MSSNQRHTNFPLVPITDFVFPSGQLQDVIRISNVGDWDTIHVYARPILKSTALGQEAFSAVRLRPYFFQIDGTSETIDTPTLNRSTNVGGRNLCVGATRLANLIIPSTLAVQLPVSAPWFSLLADYDANQTNVAGIRISVWAANEASYQPQAHFPAGDFFANWTGGDSLLGRDYGGSIGDLTRGIVVLPASAIIIELMNQTIGRGWFSWEVESQAGAAPAPAEIRVSVVNKSSNDTTNTNIDQRIYDWSGVTASYVGGIPLTGFRQGVYVANASSPPRNFNFHFTVYTEFGNS